jgi:hypothetical protein
MQRIEEQFSLRRITSTYENFSRPIDASSSDLGKIRLKTAPNSNKRVMLEDNLDVTEFVDAIFYGYLGIAE